MSPKTTPKPPPITPTPGYILCRRYIDETNTFQSVRETDSEDQLSEVLYIGLSVKDSQGINRYPHCKVGDIIIHTASNKTIDIKAQAYRFVHFTEVHGIHSK